MCFRLTDCVAQSVSVDGGRCHYQIRAVFAIAFMGKLC